MKESSRLHAFLQHQLAIEDGSLLEAGTPEHEPVISLPMEAEPLLPQNFSEDRAPRCAAIRSSQSTAENVPEFGTTVTAACFQR